MACRRSQVRSLLAPPKNVRDGAVVARQPHKLKVGGANPSPAPMRDSSNGKTLGFQPSNAGSIPASRSKTKWIFKESK